MVHECNACFTFLVTVSFHSFLPSLKWGGGGGHGMFWGGVGGGGGLGGGGEICYLCEVAAVGSLQVFWSDG